MAKETDSKLVFAHVQTDPEAFLEALGESAIEQREAILTYLQSLPEFKAIDDMSVDTIEWLKKPTI